MIDADTAVEKSVLCGIHDRLGSVGRCDFRTRDVHPEEREDDKQGVTSSNISSSRSFNDTKPKTGVSDQLRVGNLCVWNGLQRGRIYIILEKWALVCMSSGMFKRTPSDNATCLALSVVVCVRHGHAKDQACDVSLVFLI
ncbi:hypothetical protein EDD15DRAFT_2519351 [Pisolithus albus]|nr:hypothetical protein EDD15DRAFT_2519351 [Pisolithus albus]